MLFSVQKFVRNLFLCSGKETVLENFFPSVKNWEDLVASRTAHISLLTARDVVVLAGKR